MRPGRILTMTRRSFGTALSGAAVGVGLGSGSAAGAVAYPALSDPDLRDAALRGLAMAKTRGDPVQAATAEAMLESMMTTDPEGALLGRIYQLLDERPASYWSDDVAAAEASDLILLHTAIRTRRPVAFRYTDLESNKTTRNVLPLALVHPPQGIKLLAWCEVRADYRQFFVRAVQGLRLRSGDFSDQRIALLQGLLDKEAARE